MGRKQRDIFNEHYYAAAKLAPDRFKHLFVVHQASSRDGDYNSGMEIHRAAEFGPLAQKLGIKPDSRVTYRMTDRGVVIWDLAGGNKYSVTQGNPDASVERFTVPANIQRIIAASDDELKRRYSESWEDGWSEERETMFTELTYRGISALGL